MGLWGPHASANSLAARTASGLCRRNRTCTVTLLAVHAASEHEEEGDGSFQARHRRRLPRCEAVPSAPSHAAPRSATVKREDRLPAALVLVAAACSPQEESFPQLFPPQKEGAEPFDTVFLSGQGRGIKLVTEDSKLVGSGR